MGILGNGIICLLMGFAENLYLLLLLRVILGVLGANSTVGLVLISSLSTKENLHRDMGLYQNSMTVGQLISPPLGAYAVTLHSDIERLLFLPLSSSSSFLPSAIVT